MSLSVELGLVLALLTAFGSVAGFLYKFRGAREAPAVELSHPLRSTVELFRSPVYSLGIVIAFGSWGFHVGALALAPISLVQSVIAGGLVLLTVVADRLFGIKVTRRELVCVGLTAAGLAFLAATLSGDASSAHSRYPPGDARDLPHGGRRRRPRAQPSAQAAGLPGGVGRVAVGRVGHLDQGAELASAPSGDGVLIHPLAFVILIASLVGLLISARSLQLGEAVPMIALTSAAANLTTIAAGPIVFGEPLPRSTPGWCTAPRRSPW